VEIFVVHLRTAWEANPIFAGVFIPYPERGVEAIAQVAPMSPELGMSLAEVRRVKDVAQPNPHQATRVCRRRAAARAWAARL
jgi:hypothetical protein